MTGRRSITPRLGRILCVVAIAATALAAPSAPAGAEGTASAIATREDATLVGPLVAGEEHNCAIRADGSPTCWGANGAGQLLGVPTYALTQLTAGRNHTCGLRTDGSAVCWGNNGRGQLLGIPTEALTSIRAGGDHTCGLRTNGSAVCWGDDTSLQVSHTTGEALTDLSAGRLHTCGLRTNGTATCWGNNSHGWSGIPTHALTHLSSGSFHSCGLDPAGTPVCWSFFGLVALSEILTTLTSGREHTCGLRTNGTAVCWNIFSTRLNAPTDPLTQITAGADHTCGIRTDGTPICWGDNTAGQLNGVPTQPLTQISAGRSHTCGIRDNGTTICWGDNSSGQLAGRPPSLLGRRTVAAGFSHTCVLDVDATAACWGENSIGEAPTSVAGSWRNLTGGANHTCGIRLDHTVACWGANADGQSSPPPGTFTEVKAGWLYTCGIRADHTATCWGHNSSGKAPAVIGGTWQQIAVGDVHACGLRLDHTISCWGDTSEGRDLVPGGRFRQVTAGQGHTCALGSDGAARCWGSNDRGQATPPIGTFRQLSAGFQQTCGIRADGTVACWGNDDEGQSSPPTGTFTHIAVGTDHACGVRTDSTITCWGRPDSGRTTPPTHLTRSTFDLTIAVPGGGGQVTSSPAGIDCPGDCTHTYPIGTIVTLTTPTPRATVDWTGACTGPTCTLQMTRDRAATATVHFPVDITVSGDGAVCCDEDATVCATTCADFLRRPFGSTVHLSAAPAHGQRLTAWSGACTGTASTCAATIDGPTTVGAAFGPITAPTAPTITTAWPRDGAIRLQWRAGDDGGSPVTSYTITTNPPTISPITVGPEVRTLLVDGLQNCRPYTLSVIATNDVGTSPAATTSRKTPAATGTQCVRLSAAGFAPRWPTIALDTPVLWRNIDTGSHGIHERQPLGLLGSIHLADGDAHTHTFTQAGGFGILDPHTGHTSSIRVPVTLTPSTGPTDELFVVRWSTAALGAPYVYDVQVKETGAATWTALRSGTTTRATSFEPPTDGTYEFRARIRRTDTDARSGWSPPTVLTVTP